MDLIPYQILRSKRKTIAVQIIPHGQVLVRCPYGMSQREIAAFLTEKQNWIQSHLSKIPPEPAFTAEQLKQIRMQAQKIIPSRVKFWAQDMQVFYHRITLRFQRTIWGSCSADGSLSFNCLLVCVPEEILDYVIVHELCHRKQMNHSKVFWNEVAAVLPDYKIRRKWLKDNGNDLIGRLQNHSNS